MSNETMYRLLNEGEVAKSGDEVLFYGRWLPVNVDGYVSSGDDRPIRRRLTTAAPTDEEIFRWSIHDYVPGTWSSGEIGIGRREGAEWMRDRMLAIPDTDWRPDECPVTGLKFFMWLEHPDLGYVPTYGGPFDSYTIPVRDENGYCRERYCHDRGDWIEGGEDIDATPPSDIAKQLYEALKEALPALEAVIPEGHGIHPNPQFQIVVEARAALSAYEKGDSNGERR